MIAVFLIIIFSITACLESTAYAIYEINVNKNRPGGIILILLSIIGLFLPVSVYLLK